MFLELSKLKEQRSAKTMFGINHFYNELNYVVHYKAMVITKHYKAYDT